MKNISFSKESELKNILGRGGLAAFMLHFLQTFVKLSKQILVCTLVFYNHISLS